LINDDIIIRSRCTRFLSHHRPLPPAEMLRALADHQAAAGMADVHGEGGAVEQVEARVAPLLGKDRGLFFIKGVTAQLCVLSAYAVQRGCRTIALHRLSHLEVDEQNAIERVAHLTPVRLGRDAPFTVDAVDQIREPLAAVVVELPLRRAGYLLPDSLPGAWSSERERRYGTLLGYEDWQNDIWLSRHPAP
jgi:threonine aldolase